MKNITQKVIANRNGSTRGLIMRSFGAGVALLWTFGFAAASANAQMAPPKQDIDTAILETLRAMQNELRQIKELLGSGAAPPRQAPPAPAGPQPSVSLDLSNRPFRGSKDAPVTMVEFTDYECSFCGRYARETLPQIQQEYIATGKVKYYVIDLPLESIHRNAFQAAVAVRCANEQGKYWEMHDQLFASQQTLTDWNAHAAVIRIDASKFANCVASNKYADEVRKDLALTQRIGVQGTPGFYFAPSSGAKITTSSYLGGARPFPAFKEQIDALLKQQAAKNGTRQAQGGD